MVEWSKCHNVESHPDIMSGDFVVRGTRVPAQAVIDNADDGYTAEQIVAEIYPSLPVEPTRRVIAFARRAHAAAPALLRRGGRVRHGDRGELYGRAVSKAATPIKS